MEAETVINTMPMRMPLLLLMGLVVLVFVVFWIGRSRRAATVAAVVVGGFVLSFGVAALTYFIKLDSAFEQASTELRETQVADINAASVRAWTNTDTQLFTADIYPGLLETVKPLARKVRESLDTNLPSAISTASSDHTAEVDTQTIEDTPLPEVEVEEQLKESAELGERAGGLPHRIRLYGPSLPPRHRDSVLSQFGKHVRDQFPNSAVETMGVAANLGVVLVPEEHDIEEVGAGSMHLVLSLSNESSQTAPWDSDAVEVSGQLNCAIKTPHQATQVSCSYIEKPWVEAFDAFVSARPQTQLVVGYSGEFVSSESEARRLAMDNAQTQTRTSVGRVIVMADESHVIDRFAQKLSRPYGDVWREAVLMDVSLERMAPAIATARSQSVAVHRQQSTTVFGLLVLFGVAAGICVTLNVLTKGYYRGRVVVGGVVVGVIIVLLVGLILTRSSQVQEFPAFRRPTQYEGAEETASEVSGITDHEISESIQSGDSANIETMDAESNQSGDSENIEAEDAESIQSGESEAIPSGASEVRRS